MKSLKVLSALGLLAVAGAAHADVSGSMAIASSYHWRGFDLGSGTPAVSGELRYTAGPWYVAAWASSGDTTGGTELDLYTGFAGDAGGFHYDVSYISYNYPTGFFKKDETPGKFAELVGKLSYGPIGAFLNYNVAGASKSDFLNGVPRYAFAQGEYMYYGLTATFGKFSAVLGKHDEKDYTLGAGGNVVTVKPTTAAPGATGNATHLDLTYAYNDNLSFTISGILDSKLGDAEPKPKMVVTYVVPFK